MQRATILFFLGLGACAPNVQFSPLDLTTLPTASDHPDANAVLLEDSTTIEFHAVDGVAVADARKVERVKILRPKGRGWANFHRSYTDAWETVLSVHLRVTRPDGTTESLGVSDIEDVLDNGGALHGSARRIYKRFESLPVGTVVEMDSVIRSRRPELFSYAHFFGPRSVPVSKASLTVRFPEGWQAEHAVTRYWQPHAFAPAIDTTDGESRTLGWVLGPQPRQKPEPYAPSFADRSTRVAARLASWTIDGQRHEAPKTVRDLSRYLRALAADTATPTPEIKAQVAKILTEEGLSEAQKAQRLYDWVRSEIRYVAIEIGIGGWKPYSAEETFNNAAGDCKDKATLLKSMLAVAGIPSHLGSLYSHDGFPRRFTLPTLGTTNHAILGIDLPGGTIFVDPTERHVPFGELPLRDQGAEILLTKHEGSMPQRTPTTGPEDNRRFLTLDLVLSGGTRGRGRFTLKTEGAFASGLTGELSAKSGKKRKDIYLDWLRLKRGEVTEGEHERQENEPGAAAVLAQGLVDIPRLITHTGDQSVLRLSEVLKTPGYRLPETSERREPVIFGRRIERRVRASLQLAENTQVVRLPETQTVASKFGRYEISWRQEGDRVIANTHYRLDQRIIPASDYEALRAFFNQIRASAARAAVFSRKV